MTEVGLRDLRQNASEVIRRVEAGETFTVTVSGRKAAMLVPIAPVRQRWRSAEDVKHVLADVADPTLSADLEELDQAVGQSLDDPFER